MRYLLSEGRKQRLRKQIVSGARNYKKYLANKIFRVVCEDGTFVDLRYFEQDFKHLTGLDSNLNVTDFFRNCFSGKIATGNICTRQKYNWATLRTKGNYIEKIHELLYEEGRKILVVRGLRTNTLLFPYAVKNMSNNMCIGFVTEKNRARSLRKASSPAESESEKRVIAVFAKKSEKELFDELVYISSVSGLYKKDESLLEEIEDSIRLKFLEVLAKRQNDD